MGIRVLRLIEIEYPDYESFERDSSRWALSIHGTKQYGNKVYRTTTLIATQEEGAQMHIIKELDPDPGCLDCGRDNRNKTHDALELGGHLGHPFRSA
jgi:hypothetical protein